MKALCAFLAAAVVSTCAAAAGRFAVTFADYAEGEALSAKGASGGRWQVAESSALSVASHAARKGLALENVQTGEIAFAATEAPPAANDVEQYDFDIAVSALNYPDEPDAAGRAAFTVVLNEAGAAAPMGWGDGRWNVMVPPEGVDLALGAWLRLRVELRREGGAPCVSYLLKSGETYVRLATPGGRAWFAVDAAAGATEVDFFGSGHVSDFAGADEASGEEWTTYYWIGGDAGDWDKAKNWSLTPGGAAAATYPSSPGDLAVVAGPVALTLGGETACVSNLRVRITADGKTVTGGMIRPCFDLDVSRPRAGKALAAAPGETFCGTTNRLAYAWQKAPYTRDFPDATIGTDLTYTPTQDDYEHWLRFTAKDADGAAVYAKDFYFSVLPVCYLTTDDGATPTAAKEEHAGTVRIQGNDDFKQQYDGAMTIKVRGNSTAKYPKKPWKIKLDKKTNVFGLSKKGLKNKHWVMLANYNDMSQQRNKLLYDLANDIGTLGMESTWVNVILNGTLQGTYQFCEHIRVAEDRVDIFDWGDYSEKQGHDEDDLSWVDAAKEDVSGGYLFEFSAEMDAVSQFVTYSGKLRMQTMVSAPEYLKTNPAMFQKAQSILQEYWDACTSANRRAASGRHYSTLCDVDSMAAYFLINELFYNFDGRYRSRYASVDRDGKLVWGPVWDFDWSSRSVTVSSEAYCPSDGTGWAMYANSAARPNDSKYYAMFKEWASDLYFARRCCAKYWKFRDRYVAMFQDGGLIDANAAKLKASCEIDDQLWKRSRTFAADVAVLKDYLAKRVQWLDAQFKDPETFMKSCENAALQSTGLTGRECYPGGFLFGVR